MEFLNLFVENKVIPKFIQFRVANKELRNSVAYRKCLNKLLKQEVTGERFKVSERRPVVKYKFV